jgi:serine/threonine-protein kinase
VQISIAAEEAEWRLAPAPQRRVSALSLGPYRVTQRLGFGGGGEVFEAVDSRSSKRVALKTPRRDRSPDSRRASELFDEALLADSVHHPGVVSILEWGETAQGSPFIAMELLEGQPLDARLASGRLSTNESIQVLEGILESLTAVHAAGVVHRDIKPGNVFLRRVGAGLQVKLVDFGLAIHQSVRTGRAARVVGTPAYMAPERMRGDRGDVESDLYSVGAIGYELLSGRPPFGFDPGEIAKARAEALPPADPSRPKLSRFVSRLLHPSPWLRPGSASAALRRLRTLKAEL